MDTCNKFTKEHTCREARPKKLQGIYCIFLCYFGKSSLNQTFWALVCEDRMYGHKVMIIWNSQFHPPLFSKDGHHWKSVRRLYLNWYNDWSIKVIISHFCFGTKCTTFFWINHKYGHWLVDLKIYIPLQITRKLHLDIVQKVFGAHFSQDFTKNRPSPYRFGWIICFNSVHVVEKQKMEWYLQENMNFFWYQNV